jgi:tRNA (Thr-GGU) A37 N-methylase
VFALWLEEESVFLANVDRSFHFRRDYERAGRQSTTSKTRPAAVCQKDRRREKMERRRIVCKIDWQDGVPVSDTKAMLVVTSKKKD